MITGAGNDDDVLRAFNPEREVTKVRDQDKFRGCLIGGAAGDALGYAVEFLREKDTAIRYGKQNISILPTEANNVNCHIPDKPNSRNQNI